MRAAQAEEKREALKERRKIPRQGMPMLEAATRATGFEEVALGFTAELAQREAWRCLFCKKARCVEACPVHNDIPTYLQALLDGRTDEALFGNSYPLTAICGRVCYRPCEAACPVGIKAEPVAIAALERFAADRFYALHGHSRGPLAANPVADPAEVAVIGAGPAGLVCAYDLARRGWQVTVFEQHPVPGGLLWLGIPEYRLPREVIQQEVATITALGVRLRLGARLGGDVTIESLRQEGYRAIFLGIGTHRGKRMGIPGEDAYSGVQEALTFLRAVNLGERSIAGVAGRCPRTLGSSRRRSTRGSLWSAWRRPCACSEKQDASRARSASA
ncbi:MAG: FAD-dependent oxidoreductase [Deltaproteobacteria bacterium]|nr:FAD-dependent oxidoreductase [Deltaproteobacteria bacterium]